MKTLFFLLLGLTALSCSSLNELERDVASESSDSKNKSKTKPKDQQIYRGSYNFK